MPDYIEIATYISRTDFIYESTLITEFVKVSGIIDIKHIDMRFLRDYHRDNKEKCINLIDELALRGFTFHTERPTNMLPSSAYEINDAFIFVEEKGECFKHINFSRLGLANFVERFNVKTDYFFQFIQLDNFLHINSGISLEILKEEFLKCGFIFINKDKLLLENFDENDRVNAIDDNEDEKCILNIKERMLLFLGGAASTSSTEGVTVYNIYHENIFNNFREFCDLHSIIYMDSLEGMPFDDLIFFRGFGEGRVKMIAERYREFLEIGAEKMSFDNEATKNIMQKFLDKMTINPPLSGIKISSLYFENGFNVFRNFSQENSIIYVEQLNGFPFDELITRRGFGQFKIDTVREKYEKFVNGEYRTFSSSENYHEIRDLGINSYYLEIEVEGLKAIGINKVLIEEFKNMGVNLIGDLLKIEYSELSRIRKLGKTKLTKFMTDIALLRQPPEELMGVALKTIKENKNFEIFRARSIGKITLQLLGEQNNVTRERIRQIEKKILILFEGFFMLFNKQIFGNGDKAIFDMDDIRNIFTDDEDMLHIKYALMSKTYVSVVYFKELDKFLINQSLEDIRGKLDVIIEENLEAIFNFYNEIVNIDELLKEADLEFLDIDDFLIYAKQRGFRECGDYILRGEITSRYYYSYILKEYFPEGVRYSDQKDMGAVLKIAKENFNLERHTEDDTRALSAIIGENVLCDRGRYIHADYIDIPAILIGKIKSYIIDNSEETLLMGDVYHRFEEELKEQSNVNNRYFLHGVLKYYYGEEFTFARDKVSKSSGEILTTNKILENFLVEEGCPVTRESIRKHFPGWTEVMVQGSVAMNRNIINWGTGSMISSELLEITEIDKEKFRNAIESAFIELNGYCSAMVIYKNLQLKMNNFYKKNGITNHVKLFYVLEYLFEDIYYFRTPHILRDKPDKQVTILEIIIKTIEDGKVVTYEEIMDYFINKQKMGEGTLAAASKKLLSKLIEVRKGEYILKNTLPLDEESLYKIREFIEMQLSGNEYVPMISIIDYRGLPDIGYDWNPFLLQDIIEYNLPEYRFIEKEFKDRRYRFSCIVKINSQLNSLVDLIIYVLENEYNDKKNMTVQAIQQYLSLKNIINNMLPYEFLSSERVSIDSFHRVEIKLGGVPCPLEI